MKKIIPIFIQSVPVMLMVALIPMLQNDYYLASIYVLIITASFLLQKEKNDILIFSLG